MKNPAMAAMAMCGLLAGCAFGPIRVADPAAGPTAVLTVPYSVSLLTIDGANAPARLGRPGARSRDFILSAGAHEIVVQFSVIWNDPARDDHTPVRSAPATLSFTAATDTRYRIEHRIWRTLDDARAVAADPGWRIAGDNGIAVSVAPAKPAATLPSAPVPAMHPATNAPAKPMPQTAPAPPASVQQMNEWWQRATPQEREAFLKGILPGEAKK
jgi:uncharacterized protein YccT (UPF0319 family)